VRHQQAKEMAPIQQQQTPVSGRGFRNHSPSLDLRKAFDQPEIQLREAWIYPPSKPGRCSKPSPTRPPRWPSSPPTPARPPASHFPIDPPPPFPHSRPTAPDGSHTTSDPACFSRWIRPRGLRPRGVLRSRPRTTSVVRETPEHPCDGLRHRLPYPCRRTSQGQRHPLQRLQTFHPQIHLPIRVRLLRPQHAPCPPPQRTRFHQTT
jgi:hypothetical protein